MIIYVNGVAVRVDRINAIGTVKLFAPFQATYNVYMLGGEPIKVSFNIKEASEEPRVAFEEAEEHRSSLIKEWEVLLKGPKKEMENV